MASSDRDWDSRQYKAWRLSVKRRDKFKCRKCGTKKRLQVHHIRRWADSPELRFQVSNGITLCFWCHKEIWDREAEHEEYFTTMVNPDNLIRIQRMLRDQETNVKT